MNQAQLPPTPATEEIANHQKDDIKHYMAALQATFSKAALSRATPSRANLSNAAASAPIGCPPLFYHPCYSQLELPVNHRYPIGKYRALYQHLLTNGFSSEHFLTAPAATESMVALCHCPTYIDALKHGTLDHKAMRRIGFPWSSALYQRSLQSIGGTIATAFAALECGMALHLSGGYHHAFYAEGAGFCLFNDLAIAAAMVKQQRPDLGKILIFDCDVHQGDGTAVLFSEDDQIITASLHGEKNFPARKQQSDWDIGLAHGCTDDDYLTALQQSLSLLLRLHQPELVIYDAGVDIHVQDDLGLLSISTTGIYQRDHFVFQSCRDAGIPVAAVIGGGYQRDVTALSDIHAQLFHAAMAVWQPNTLER